MKEIRLVTGLILIDAPASALNNAGIEPGRLAENKVIVKKIRLRGRDEYPYVSGQAFKRWWRDTIHRKFAWSPSPITREEKVAYTEANPITYEEDDVFGYMLAPARGEEKGLVYRRIAPLKCTPLISLFSNVITDDFGVFARGPAEKEPVPYEQEFYSTILKGAFSLMLSEVGIFQRGRGKDLPAMIDAEEVKLKEKESKEAFSKRVESITQKAQEKKAEMKNQTIILPEKERKRRIQEAFLALADLAGGAKESNYLTEVSPKFIVAAILDCANHVFMDCVRVQDGKVIFDVENLNEITRDYAKNFYSPIFIGLRKGFLEDSEYNKIQNVQSSIQWPEQRWSQNLSEEERKSLTSDVYKVADETKLPLVVFNSPKEVINKVVQHIERIKL